MDSTPDVTPIKQCSKCGECLPSTSEYFSADSRLRSGLRADCKKCYKAHRATKKKRDYEYNRAYYAAHKERKQELRRIYDAANREQRRQRERIYSAANRDKKVERDRRYREANRERLNRRAREARVKNKTPYVAKDQRRRALKLNAPGTHTAEDVQRQYKAQKGKCYYCGVQVGKNYHVDHVIPLSRGGSNGPENLVIACPFCNDSKKDKLPHEWPQGNRLL